MKEHILNGAPVSLDDLLGISKLQDVLALILLNLNKQDAAIKELQQGSSAASNLEKRMEEVSSRSHKVETQLGARLGATEEQVHSLEAAVASLDALQAYRATLDARLADIPTKEALTLCVDGLSARIDEVQRSMIDRLPPWMQELDIVSSGLAQRCSSAEQRIAAVEEMCSERLVAATSSAASQPGSTSAAERDSTAAADGEAHQRLSDRLEAAEAAVQEIQGRVQALGRGSASPRLEAAEGKLRDLEARVAELGPELAKQGRTGGGAAGERGVATGGSADLGAGPAAADHGGRRHAAGTAAEEHGRVLAAATANEHCRRPAGPPADEHSRHPAATGAAAEAKALEPRLHSLEQRAKEAASRAAAEAAAAAAARAALEGRLGPLERGLLELTALREAAERARRGSESAAADIQAQHEDSQKQLQLLADLEAELSTSQQSIQKDLRVLSDKQAADALRLTRELRELTMQINTMTRGASATARCLSCFDRRNQQQHKIAVGVDGKVYQRGFGSEESPRQTDSWLPDAASTVPSQPKLPIQGGAGASFRRFRGWTSTLEQPRLGGAGSSSAPLLPRHHSADVGGMSGSMSFSPTVALGNT